MKYRPPPMQCAPANTAAECLTRFSPPGRSLMTPFSPTLGPLRQGAGNALSTRRAESGTTASARPASRPATGGSSLSAISFAAGVAAPPWQSAKRSCPGSCRSTSSARQAVAPAIADYRPTDPQHHLTPAQFIEEVRSITADPVIIRQNWLQAYEFVTDEGALTLNDYARANDPFGKVGRSSSGRRMFQCYPRLGRLPGRLDDTVRSFTSGNRTLDCRLTIVVEPPRDAERLAKNR